VRVLSTLRVSEREGLVSKRWGRPRKIVRRPGEPAFFGTRSSHLHGHAHVGGPGRSRKGFPRHGRNGGRHGPRSGVPLAGHEGRDAEGAGRPAGPRFSATIEGGGRELGVAFEGEVPGNSSGGYRPIGVVARTNRRFDLRYRRRPSISPARLQSRRKVPKQNSRRPCAKRVSSGGGRVTFEAIHPPKTPRWAGEARPRHSA